MMFDTSITMSVAEQVAPAAWTRYASALETFSLLVTDRAGRHAMLRQHEKVIRFEAEWKRAYSALLEAA